MVFVVSVMLFVIIFRVVWKYGGLSLLNINKGGNFFIFIDIIFNGGSVFNVLIGIY